MNEVDKIKELCVTKEMSIAELERKCGFSNGYISGLRKGFLPPERLEKVAKVLNVSTEYFRQKNDVDYTITIGDETLLIEAYRKESADGILHTYAKLIKSMKENPNHE